MMTTVTRGALMALLAIAMGCGGGASSKGSGAASGTEGAPAPAVGTPSNDLIPREVFFGNPERQNVQISPDGKHLSWLAPKDGVMNIWVAPIGELGKAQAITADATRPVREYF